MYLKQWGTSVRAVLVLSVLTGLAYPFAMTGLAQLLFPKEANGSLILSAGRPVGSRLIGQSFDEPRYFWGRLSATGPTAYNGAASSGSNLGPANPALLKAVGDRIEALRSADPESRGPVPVDLVTASASGLDPEISPAAADFQLKRVARARGWPESAVERLIRENTRPRFLGLLGEPGVNVLALNNAMDRANP
ncbi:MAG: potassium-transporting ATPase subunit KdpC [Elusimicrobia bacterium]|nr:potassium-transporting ATPase subunit KdpC [Elusimicrobiota bacterium]